MKVQFYHLLNNFTGDWQYFLQRTMSENMNQLQDMNHEQLSCRAHESATFKQEVLETFYIFTLD